MEKNMTELNYTDANEDVLVRLYRLSQTEDNSDSRVAIEFARLFVEFPCADWNGGILRSAALNVLGEFYTFNTVKKEN
jgi:hypothetical protein